MYLTVLCTAPAHTISLPKSAQGMLKSITSWVQGVEEESIQKQFDIPATTKIVRIDHVGGTISLNFWKKKDILIALKKRGSEESRKKTGLKEPLPVDGDTVSIATYTDPEDPSIIDCTITLPETVVLDIHNGTGNMVIEKPTQALTIALENGQLTVTNPQAPITATLAKGNIEVSGAQADMNLTLENGLISLTNPQEAVTVVMHQGTVSIDAPRGALDISVHHGQVELFNVMSKNIRVAVADGTVLLEQKDLAPTAALFIQATRDITVALPASTRAELIANTCKGTVTSQILCTLQIPPLRLTKEAWKRMPGHVHGMLGPRGASSTTTADGSLDAGQANEQFASVTLESEKGDIAIEKF
jgi:hypothetical protein